MVTAALDLMALEQAHTSGAYLKRDLQIVRGEGATLYDADGNAYIDCVGGQGAANLGHSHPAVVAALREQAETLISCPVARGRPDPWRRGCAARRRCTSP